MESFEKVYKSQVEPVFRFVFRRVGRRDLAEDITSEVFLKLYQNWDGIDQSQLPNWLFTVARNSIYSYWRHEEVAKRYVEENSNSAAGSFPPPALGALFHAKELKPLHRICLTLRYVHDMDRSEIGSRTGLSEEQVKSCLQYARKLLRKRLLGEST